MQSKLGPSPASACCIQPPRIHVADAVHAAAMCVMCLRPEDITSAEVIVFPGVGSFGSAMEVSCHSRVPCSGPSHPLHERLVVDAHQCVLCQVISSSPTTSALYMCAGGGPLPRFHRLMAVRQSDFVLLESGAGLEGLHARAARLPARGPPVLRHLPRHADAVRGQRGVPRCPGTCSGLVSWYADVDQ